MIKLGSRRLSALVAVLLSAGLIASPASRLDAGRGATRGLQAHRRGAGGVVRVDAVAPAGDVNGDGLADVLVGAPGVDSKGGEFSGRAYLFLGPLDGARSAADADAIFTAEGLNDNLGFSIAAGDLNDDGKDDVIIGARSNDKAGIQAGRVYVFFGPVTGTRSVRQADLKIAGKEFDEAGSAVAAGDLNADGVEDLVIGAHNGTGPGVIQRWAGVGVLRPDRSAEALGDRRRRDPHRRRLQRGLQPVPRDRRPRRRRTSPTWSSERRARRSGVRDPGTRTCSSPRWIAALAPPRPPTRSSKAPRSVTISASRWRPGT